jgi:flagellar biogenesis protein FliO
MNFNHFRNSLGMQRFFFPNPVSILTLLLLLSLLRVPIVDAQDRRGLGGSPTSAFPDSIDGSGGSSTNSHFVAVSTHSAPIRLPIALVPGSGSLSPRDDQDSPMSASGTALPARRPLDASERSSAGKHRQALVTTAASLAVVLGLFLLLVWVQRRASGPRGSMLPGEVIQTLGRARLNSRQEMHLVRVGNKLLLLAVTANSAETLTEITDPDEIHRLNGICHQNQPGSISASFREILSQLQQPTSTSRIR